MLNNSHRLRISWCWVRVRTPRKCWSPPPLVGRDVTDLSLIVGLGFGRWETLRRNLNLGVFHLWRLTGTGRLLGTVLILVLLLDLILQNPHLKLLPFEIYLQITDLPLQFRQLLLHFSIAGHGLVCQSRDLSLKINCNCIVIGYDEKHWRTISLL